MKSNNVQNFDKAAAEASRRVVAEASEAIRAVALDAYYTMVKRAKDSGNGTGSPVASGRLAASFRVSINSIDVSTAAEDKNYRYPSASVHKYNADNLPKRTIANTQISRVAAMLRTYKLGDKIYIANSVPYIRRIEIGQHSWQTPGGIFGPAMRAVQKRFANLNLKVTRV